MGFSFARSSDVSHGFFDEAFAEGAGVCEVDGELRVAVGALRRLQHLVRVPSLARARVEEHRK